MADEHKGKMAVKLKTPLGLELDEHGKPIPFEQCTEGDKAKVRENIAQTIRDEENRSIKNPNNEAEVPAPMPQQDAGTKSAPKTDPAGQQGGTTKTGRG